MNILTPIDSVGYLVTDRFEDERLGSYARRLGEVARTYTHWDESDPEWLELRARELSARVGSQVVIERAPYDEALFAEASAKLLSWERLEREAPGTVLPLTEPTLAGPAPRYNRASGEVFGALSPSDLSPTLSYSYTPSGARVPTLTCEAGYALAPGGMFYISGTRETIHQRGLEEMTETVLLPLELRSDHGHKVEVVTDRQLTLTGEDGHTHTLVFGEDGRLTSETDWDEHTHEVRYVTPPTPHRVLIEVSPVTIRASGQAPSRFGGTDALSYDSASGFPLAPYYEGTTVDVTIGGERYFTWVAPYEYGRGDYVLQSSADSLTVVDHEADGYSPDVTIAGRRAMQPVLAASEGELFEADTRHPNLLRVEYNEGWPQISNEWGLSEQIRVTLNAPTALELPLSGPGEITGFGPLPAAERATVLEASRHGLFAFVRVATEDRYSGFAGEASFSVQVEGGGVSQLRSDARGYFSGTLAVPESAAARYVEAWINPAYKHRYVLPSASALASGGYGVSYGTPDALAAST